MSSRKNILPYLAVGVTILCIGFSAFFVHWANVPPSVFGFYRIGIATLILTPFFLRRVNRQPRAGSIAIPLWSLLLFPVLAGLCSAMDQFIWTFSLRFTSAANATLLGNTSPLWVALAAWLIFRERTGGIFWLGLGLTLSGSAIVMGSDFLRHPTLGWGDLLCICSATFYAAFYLFSQRSRRHLDTLSHVYLVSLTGTLAMLVLCLVTRAPLTGYPPRTYLILLGAALMPQLAGYLALGYALGHLPASVVSPTMLFQPVLTALLAIPILGEALQPVQLIGGLVVLSGIYLVNRSREKRSGAAPAAASVPVRLEPEHPAAHESTAQD